MAEKNPNKLYDNIKSMKANLESMKEIANDLIEEAKQTMNNANEFGGVISKVLKEQMAKYLIPSVQNFMEPFQKLIDDNTTPGSMIGLTTFLDSVPLAMTRQEPTVTELASPVVPTNANVVTPQGTTNNPVDDIPQNASYNKPVQESCGKIKESINLDEVWDLYQDIKEQLGPDMLCDDLADAMGNYDLAENLEYICRMREIESPFLNEGFEEALHKVKESLDDVFVDMKDSYYKLYSDLCGHIGEDAVNRAILNNLKVSVFDVEGAIYDIAQQNGLFVNYEDFADKYGEEGEFEFVNESKMNESEDFEDEEFELPGYEFAVYELDPENDYEPLDPIEYFDDLENAKEFAKEQEYPTHIVVISNIDPDNDPEVAEYWEEFMPYEPYEVVWESFRESKMKEAKNIVQPGLIERDPSYDFSDDGTNFRGYVYKGVLPITAAASGNKIYYDIRPDYLGFDYHDYENLPTGEFNGADKEAFDPQKLAANCEEIYQKLIIPNMDQVKDHLIHHEEHAALAKFRRDKWDDNLKNGPRWYKPKYSGWARDNHERKFDRTAFRKAPEYQDYLNTLKNKGLAENPDMDTVEKAKKNIQHRRDVKRNMWQAQPNIPGLEGFDGFFEKKMKESIEKYQVIRTSKIGSSLDAEVSKVKPLIVGEFETKEEAEKRVKMLNDTITDAEKEFFGFEYKVEAKKFLGAKENKKSK